MFDDMKADMKVNKKLSRIVTELLLKGRKLKTKLVFFFHNLISKCRKLYTTRYFIMKIRKEIIQ